MIIPAALGDELVRLIDDWATTRPAWLERRMLDRAKSAASPTRNLITGLGAGETEAISPLKKGFRSPFESHSAARAATKLLH